MNPSSNRVTRRAFLQTTSTFSAALALGTLARPFAARAGAATRRLGITDLPMGAAPPPLSFTHFPDRLHAFVWRNWPLVPVSRMARVVGARTGELMAIGKAMGLDRPPRVTTDQQKRSYITVIKRNWHLLPYDQLLELLGWTPAELAYTLREDDFLFIKLGGSKPKCEPLRYQAPDEATRDRENRLARIVREYFPQGVLRGGERPFQFVADLSRKPTAAGAPPRDDHLRFCYSYFALYGDPLLDRDADPYPDGYLGRLACAGVTGVWLQAVLYKLAPFPWEPDLSVQAVVRLKNLRSIARRARKHGIRVFLYLNEPRAMPLRFFETRPELKGAVEGDHAALCTSLPEVRDYLREAVAHICRSVPELGGFFSISASENFTHCWSHGGGATCPRCGKRPPADVIAEVNRTLQDGISQSGQSAKLLVWDWGWNDAWAPDIIQQLPAQAALMSVSEWLLPIERGGIKTEVGEYSLSSVGPGPRAKRHWQLARARGLPIVAKIQAANSWELSALPWIPAVANTALHGENLSRAGVRDVMLGWTLGGYPSPNLEVVGEAINSGSAAHAMRRVAERRFGPALAPLVVTAWGKFSAAFREFPFHVGTVYSGPQQLGPANLLWPAPTGRKASMVGFAFDDLDSWRAVYPPEIFIQQLGRVSDGFSNALIELDAALAMVNAQLSTAQRQALDEERRLAQAAALHFRSAANQARFILARNSALAMDNPGSRTPHVAVLKQVLEDEIVLARRLYELQLHDSRLGFEASNHYFYLPLDLVEKVLNCRDLLDNWLNQLA